MGALMRRPSVLLLVVGSACAADFEPAVSIGDTTTDAATAGDDDPNDDGGPPTGPACGDGTIEGTEECDLGPLNGTGMYCRPDCRANTCPDGYVGPGEICDDGNVDNSDACSNACGPASCGDGVLQPQFGEQCDNGPGNSTSGACLPSCKMAACNDGALWQGVELCDSTNTPEQSCTTLQHDGGTLLCNATCDGYDETNCFDCGDGVHDPNEECDGADLNQVTCEELGFTAGTLACTASCTFDPSGCTLCGNNVAQPGEGCDGTSFHAGMSTCQQLGYGGGTLSCTPACTLDPSMCSPCGNAVVDPGEQCDGSVPPLLTCTLLGWSGGMVTCTPMCTFGGCCQAVGTACDAQLVCCTPAVCGGNALCCLPAGQPCSTAGSVDPACCSGMCGATAMCT